MSKKVVLSIICLLGCLALIFPLLYKPADVAATPPPAVAAASASATFAIEPADNVGAEETAEVRAAADAAVAFYGEAGIAMKKPLTLVLTRDRKAYLAAVMARFHISEIEAARLIRGTDALAGSDMIVFHMDGVPSSRQRTFLVAHEMTHYFQRQIAGKRAGGAMWMMEGMADATGAQVVARQGYMTEAAYRQNWQGGITAAPAKPALADLHTSSGWSQAIGQYGNLTYKMSGLAVLLLTERYGRERVLQYYDYLGQGETPEAAFEHAFGVPMADFELEMARLVKKAA